MTKIPKKAQVAFNQFIFDTMMDKIRDSELLQKKVLAHEDLLKVHVQKIGDLGRKVDNSLPIWDMNRRLPEINHRIESLETTRNFLNKEQGEMRERISRNEAAHKGQHASLQLRISELEKASDRQTEMEMMQDRQIEWAITEIKALQDAKKSGRPKKKLPFSKREGMEPCADTKKSGRLKKRRDIMQDVTKQLENEIRRPRDAKGRFKK